MGFFSIILIAIGLSMDSFAASVSGGMIMKPFCWKQSMRIAFVMGFFQGGMTLLGWLLGESFSSCIQYYDHWVAFVLLAFLGGKMIYESFQHKDDVLTSLSMKTLLTLGVATSIDALAVGVGLAFFCESISIPAFIIGIVTFSLSLLGVGFGYRFGQLKKINIELVGGFILIGIGCKILIEHLS